jgi:hypothetical protein
VATLTTERDALRAVTEQQAGLIAAYQAALGGRAFDASADELLRVEAERNAVADECNRVDGELAELQRAYRALGEERNELLADNERLMVQLATTPAATVPSGVDTSGYEAELRRCWLVIAWLRKAIGEGMACRLLGVPDVVGLVSQADQFAEVGRQAAEGVRRQREAVPHG